MQLAYEIYESPMGPICVISDEENIIKLHFEQDKWMNYLSKHEDIVHGSKLCSEAVKQLEEYFDKRRKSFDLPLKPEGTTFQKKVWEALNTIPYGELRSYSDIANIIGNPKGRQAVGQANKVNPLPIFIPCHRVIGKSGKLIGYAGSRTDLQKQLLEVEGCCKNEEGSNC